MYQCWALNPKDRNHLCGVCVCKRVLIVTPKSECACTCGCLGAFNAPVLLVTGLYRLHLWFWMHRCENQGPWKDSTQKKLAASQGEASEKQLCKLNILQKNKPQTSCQPGLSTHSLGPDLPEVIDEVQWQEQSVQTPETWGRGEMSWLERQCRGRLLFCTFLATSHTKRSQRKSCYFHRKMVCCVYIYVCVCIHVSLMYVHTCVGIDTCACGCTH